MSYSQFDTVHALEDSGNVLFTFEAGPWESKRDVALTAIRCAAEIGINPRRITRTKATGSWDDSGYYSLRIRPYGKRPASYEDFDSHRVYMVSATGPASDYWAWYHATIYAEANGYTVATTSDGYMVTKGD